MCRNIASWLQHSTTADVPTNQKSLPRRRNVAYKVWLREALMVLPLCFFCDTMPVDGFNICFMFEYLST